MNISNRNIYLLEAHKRGYSVLKDGTILNHKQKKIKGSLDSHGYIFISLNRKMKVGVHRLMAFQKYGYELFKEGIEVRHIDGNPLNNSFDNIKIGTKHDNQMDKPIEIRRKVASIRCCNFSVDRRNEIISYYNNCKSYKKTKLQFGIKSSGTLHYILNNIYIN